MEAQPEPNQGPPRRESPKDDPEYFEEFEEEEEDDDDDDDEEEEEEESESMSPEARMRNERAKMESLVKRLSKNRVRVRVRVHDVIIKGNTKTKDSLIHSEVEAILRDATSFRQLLRAASIANGRLQRLDIFDSVNITLDAGPPELPGSANVVIEVSESKNPLTRDLGIYREPEARSWSLEQALKLKNFFGYGDIWDFSTAYGWGQASEVSVGVSLPKFKALATPLSARFSHVSQDWWKLSSSRENVTELSLGLLSTGNHDVSYNLSWFTLTNPSQMSSDTVWRQLGHNLFSALKYAYKIDRRDSRMRPTRGHALVSTTQIGGLIPDFNSLRLIRQEFDLRYAIPMGFYRAALNFGISGRVVFPLGSGYLNTPSYLSERLFMGGNSSPICSLRGPTSALGFKAWGFGPAEPRRLVRDNSNNGNPDDSRMDHMGGDLALSAFADFSFDFPLRVFQEAGVHGHVFVRAGSLSKITENAYRDFSFEKFRDSFRSSAGFGIIIPFEQFRMEVNYCYILKQHEHNRGKTGVQFSFFSSE
ncbi:putative cell surface protein [Handroanthus impetiginosus]|uniref:Putative cell surface protein n=1 Tax=Handroanthus impetiginosus TaxID=429701 RepID=A0A2G9GEW7_9LAMI|nr:putative cell surface protein [Handroanthus impetiginosus]